MNRFPHAFEAKVIFKSRKSWLIEMTLGGRYFLPFKCHAGGEDGLYEPDEDGNRNFEVNDWWWNKREDFEAEE